MKGVRGAIFIVACLLVAVTISKLEFSLTDVVIITGVSASLALLTLDLPWGGQLYPADALVVCICLIRPGIGAVIGAASIALASNALRYIRWRNLVTPAIRNTAGAAVAVGLWSRLIPHASYGSGYVADWLSMTTLMRWLTSAAAVPPLLLTSLAYFAIASAMDSLMRNRRDFTFGEYWLLNFGRNMHHHLFTILLGAIMAVASRTDIGSAALILFAFPVILTRDALRRSLDLRTSRLDAIKALASSVDARDRHTYDHSSRVARLAAMLAREMGFSESTVEMIEGGALLHDIGKLSIDTEILTKPGPLDDEERKAIRAHPLRSAEVVSRVELLQSSAEIVRHHHERPDGKGYPHGLKGHEIPVGARILNVADAFDAMISDRPYRKGKTVEMALEELRRGSGTEFDPVVVEYLIRLVNDGKLQFLGIG